MTLSGFEAASDLLTGIAAGRLQAVDVLETFIARIERHNAGINAVVARSFGRGRLRAEETDQRVRRGAALGTLDGLPFTVKDSIEAAGLPTTAGALSLMGYRPAHHAPAIERLTTAQAILLGKTNLPEWAGDYQTHNKVFGAASNPWNPAHTPGGSSGGSAAAVAAGLSPLDIGSDLAGSIRIPAHFCGIYGHKPSFGVVPFAGHVPPGPGHQSHTDVAVLGPLARDARDLERALLAMAGPPAGAETGWNLTLPPPRARRLQDLRIAYWLDDHDLAVDTEVLNVLEQAVERIAHGGPGALRWRKPELSLKDVRRIGRTLIQSVIGAHMPARTYGQARAFAGRLGAMAPVDRTLRRAAKDVTLSHREWVAADGERQLMRKACADFFQDFDVLLMPVAPIAAPPRADGVRVERRSIRINGRNHPAMTLGDWCTLAGLAYLPATVAPVGRTKQGLPVGIQIIGPYLGDRTTIAAARLIGDVAGGFERPPSFA